MVEVGTRAFGELPFPHLASFILSFVHYRQVLIHAHLDEVSAIILDPGYSTTRAGFAGEDAPKSVIPTHYAKYSTDAQEKYVYGDNIYVAPRPGMSVHNPMGKDGIVEDWDMAEKLWEYSFTSRLTRKKPGNPMFNGLNDATTEDLPTEMELTEESEKPLSENPLLMTEPGWNPVKAREKAIELAMENWGTPAYYLARTGPLASFVLHSTISISS